MSKTDILQPGQKTICTDRSTKFCLLIWVNWPFNSITYCAALTGTGASVYTALTVIARSVCLLINH